MQVEDKMCSKHCIQLRTFVCKVISVLECGMENSGIHTVVQGGKQPEGKRSTETDGG